MKSDVILHVVLSREEYEKVLSALVRENSAGRKTNMEAWAATLLIAAAEAVMRGAPNA